MFLIANDFTKASGYAINTEEMNPESYSEIFFEGKTLNEAIKDYYRKVSEYWIYNPSNGEQIFEDIDEAIEYVEDGEETTFENFKKSQKVK